jgi:hypothetical protein
MGTDQEANPYSVVRKGRRISPHFHLKYGIGPDGPTWGHVTRVTLAVRCPHAVSALVRDEHIKLYRSDGQFWRTHFLPLLVQIKRRILISFERKGRRISPHFRLK